MQGALPLLNPSAVRGSATGCTLSTERRLHFGLQQWKCSQQLEGCLRFEHWVWFGAHQNQVGSNSQVSPVGPPNWSLQPTRRSWRLCSGRREGRGNLINRVVREKEREPDKRQGMQNASREIVVPRVGLDDPYVSQLGIFHDSMKLQLLWKLLLMMVAKPWSRVWELSSLETFRPCWDTALSSLACAGPAFSRSLEPLVPSPFKCLLVSEFDLG